MLSSISIIDANLDQKIDYILIMIDYFHKKNTIH